MDSFQQIDRHDSRHAMKQRDIAATVARMQDVSKKKQKAWEDSFEDTLVEATENAVLKGGVNCVGSTAAYRRKYDSVFKGDN